MEEKIIQIVHHVRDYECMWSGIEDMYSAKLGEVVPPFFFFSLSGVGNFTYLKQKDFSQIGWSNGMVDKMYEFMAPIAKFSYERIEGLTFEKIMTKAKEEINQERPVILGPLDMYYLKYFPKIYQHIHIPIHYVMMIGYSDEKVYLLDGGIKEVQAITYTELEIALNVKKTELGDKNGMYCIHLSNQLPSLFEIAKKGFYQKARIMLEPKSEEVGISAMRRLAKDFPNLKKELSPKVYRQTLENIVTYAGTVPQLPMRLLGKQDKGDILYRAAREKLVDVLYQLGEKYEVEHWLHAAEQFKQSGEIIELMVNEIVDYLLEQRDHLDTVPQHILQIADLEEKAYQKLMIRI